MLNLVIPLASKSAHFPASEYPFPAPLIEINGKTIIERVLSNLETLEGSKKITVILLAEDCKNYYLDETIRILTKDSANIVVLDHETQGSACSVLFAIDTINNEFPLLIVNGDQLFDCSLETLICPLRSADAGVVTFESVHPRWSYVSLEGRDRVVEVSEKRPLSNSAVAGLYYFSRGLDFVGGAMRMIEKGDSVNGRYFVAPVLNQLILDGKRVKASRVETPSYHTFYSPQKIIDYQRAGLSC